MEEFIFNAKYFSNYTAISMIEKQLLKKAKELRYCLKHFGKFRL